MRSVNALRGIFIKLYMVTRRVEGDMKATLSEEEILRFPTIRRSIRLSLAAEFLPVLTYLVVDWTGNLYADGGGPELREGAPGWNSEQHQSRVDIILTSARRTRKDVDMIDIKLRGECIRQ